MGASGGRPSITTVPWPPLISTVRPADRTRKAPSSAVALVRPTDRRSTSRPPPRTSPSPTWIFTMSRPGPANSARPCSSTVESTVLEGMVSMVEAPRVTVIQGKSRRAVASSEVRNVSPVRSLSPAARRRHELFSGSSARSTSRSTQPRVPIAMPAPGGAGGSGGAGRLRARSRRRQGERRHHRERAHRPAGHAAQASVGAGGFPAGPRPAAGGLEPAGGRRRCG